MFNNQNPADHAPQGGEWFNYNAADIGVNNQFGGEEGSFFTTPERSLWDQEDYTVSFYRVGDRVTHIQVSGPNIDTWLFRHQNLDGTNIHGGNHTTNEWFTIDVGQFYLVSEDGRIYPDSPLLTSKPGFEGSHTLTPVTPLPVPCFGAETYFHVRKKGEKDFYSVKIIDLVGVPSGEYEIRVENNKFVPILWIGGRGTEEETFWYNGVELTGQHRVLIENKWAKAKHLAAADCAYSVERDWPYRCWVGHVLLESHEAIYCFGGQGNQAFYAESLLVTDRSLSGFKATERLAIRHLVPGNQELTREVWKKGKLKKYLDRNG